MFSSYRIHLNAILTLINCGYVFADNIIKCGNQCSCGITSDVWIGPWDTWVRIPIRIFAKPVGNNLIVLINSLWRSDPIWRYRIGSTLPQVMASGIGVSARRANERRRRYIVTSSLICWTQTQNDPCGLLPDGTEPLPEPMLTYYRVLALWLKTHFAGTTQDPSSPMS